MRRITTLFAAGAVVLAMALPAWAATSTVHMTSALKFDPTPISIALGDTVMWTNDSSLQHTATQNQGFFDTGTVAGEGSASKVFKFGGTYAYHCLFHGSQGMRGRVDVPDKWLNQGEQHPGDVQRIRVASVKAPAPLAFDVQMRQTGDDTWTPFKQKVTTAVVKFTPSDAGEFQFRSRLHRLSNNNVSGWSPPAFVEVVNP